MTSHSIDLKAIRRARLSKGYSVAELAEIAGVGRATLYFLESGQRVPRMRTVRVLAEALDVPVTQFLDLEVQAR